MTEARIMIVEDESIVAEDIRMTLVDKGYEVSGVASSGEEVMESLEVDQCPDLVLMDIKLKGMMDGIEAADRIGRQYDIPVIYLTAFADEELLNRARLTTPLGYIIKPFKPRELFSAIEIALYRRDMERKLARSEALYRAVVEDQTELICRFTRNGNTIFVNGAFTSAFGLSGDPVQSHNFFSLVGCAGFDRAESLLDSLTRDNPVLAVECETETSDGSSRWFQWTLRLLFQEKGYSQTEYQAVGRDVTERKKAQALLEQSHRRARTLLDAPSEPFMLIDAHRAVIDDLNDAAGNILRPGGGDLRGMELEGLLPPDTHLDLLDKIRHVRNTGLPLTYEEEREVPLLENISIGVAFSTKLYPLFDERERVVQVAMFSHDISLHKQLENRLQENLDSYAGLLENLPQGLLIYDLEGSILELNDLGARMLGVAPGALIGKPLEQILADKADFETVDQYKGSFSFGVFRFDSEFLTAEAGLLEVEISQCEIKYKGAPAVLSLFRKRDA